MPTIITAGDAVSAASSLAGSNDGALSIVVGPAGGKLTAIAIAADGTVTPLKYPPGAVIQMQIYAVDAGSSTTATSLANTSVGSKVFTPRSTNSILLVSCTFSGATAILGATNTTAYFQLMEGGTGFSSTTVLETANSSGGSRVQTPCAISFRLTNAALTARSFTLGAYSSTASAAVSAVSQTFTITEVQA